MFAVAATTLMEQVLPVKIKEADTWYATKLDLQIQLSTI
jgi:hypothetical protein